jgi:hypothetical protein
MLTDLFSNGWVSMCNVSRARVPSIIFFTSIALKISPRAVAFGILGCGCGSGVVGGVVNGESGGVGACGGLTGGGVTVEGACWSAEFESFFF